jgi:ABC-2 type transport system permease protein
MTALDAAGAAPAFRSALAAECWKLRTLRVSYVLPVLACAATLGLAVLLCWLAGTGWQALGGAERSTFDPVHEALEAVAYGNMAFIAFGVNAVGVEYATGMIRTSMTATPRRGRFLLAKCLPLFLGAFAAGLVMAAAATAVGLAVLSRHGISTPAVTDLPVLRAILGSALGTAFVTLGGAAGAFMFRNILGALVAANVGAALPSSLSFLPDGLQRDVLRYLPTNAADGLTRVVVDPDSPMHIGTLPAFGLLAVWTVVTVAGARSILDRHDA